MTTTMSLFEEADIEVREPDPLTTVQVGSRVAQIPLRKRRREACNKLMEILQELEGKDIHIGSYDAGGRHYRVDNLKLPRLKLDWYPPAKYSKGYIPSVIVLWGSRSAQVRIFTNYLVAVREQEYQGYTHWLLDFRNGLWEHPIDNYYSHYACLTITKFKD
ncbi:unnamed protein product [marine sediment metagenome]|uniref:Uncharacterized protein n=1 Tax=marine sediment metagenome TaxID=412755 RepID=X1Q921_9ZZZZ